jgi:hypothetical protein
MVFAQMFPGMGWIPLIMLLVYVGIALAVIGGVAFVCWLLPLAWMNKNSQSFTRILVGLGMFVGVTIFLVQWSGPNYRQCQEIEIGMTVNDVQSRLGNPSNRHRNADGEESWYYYPDWSGLGYFHVKFDPEGIVVFKWME